MKNEKKKEEEKGTLVDIFRSESVCVCCGRARKREKICGYDYWGTKPGCWWCSSVYKLTEDYIEQLLVVSPLAFHCAVVLHLLPIKYCV